MASKQRRAEVSAFEDQEWALAARSVTHLWAAPRGNPKSTKRLFRIVGSSPPSPCWQVERELGSVMLDNEFAAKLAQSKGRQMLDLPSSQDPDVADAKDNDGLTTILSQTALRPPEPAQNAHQSPGGVAYPDHHPLTRTTGRMTDESVADMTADEKIEENCTKPVEPLLSQDGSEPASVSQCMASKAMTSLGGKVKENCTSAVEPLPLRTASRTVASNATGAQDENVVIGAAKPQPQQQLELLQDSMISMHGTMHAMHERVDVVMTTMQAMNERLAAIELAMERQPRAD